MTRVVALSGHPGEMPRGVHEQRRTNPVPIGPMVVLTHPRSRLGRRRNPTVEAVASLDAVLEHVASSPSQLAAGQVAELARLVQRDHAYHQPRRRRQ